MRKKTLDVTLQNYFLQQQVSKLKEKQRRSSGAYVPKQSLYYEDEDEPSHNVDNDLKKSFDEIVASLTEENDRLKEELASSSERLQNSEQQLREAREGVSTKPSEEKATILKLRKEKGEYEDRLRRATNERAMMKEKLRDLKEQNEGLQCSLTEEVSRASTEVEQIYAERRTFEENNEELHRTCTEHAARVKSLSEQANNLADEKNELKRVVTEKSKSIAALNVQVDALKFEAQSVRDEFNSTVQEADAAKDEVSRLNNKLTSMRELNAKQNSDLHTLQSELNRAIKQRDEARQARQDLSNTLNPSDLPGINPGNNLLTSQPPQFLTTVQQDLQKALKTKNGSYAKNWRETVLQEMENTLKQVCETQARLEVERSRFLAQYCRRVRHTKPPLLTNAKLAI